MLIQEFTYTICRMIYDTEKLPYNWRKINIEISEIC